MPASGRGGFAASAVGAAARDAGIGGGVKARTSSGTSACGVPLQGAWVLIRRSPLIVLLSLEIMLNGANLALIAFSRHFAQGDGQIFALTVMAVAASEVVVGLGPDRGDRAPEARPRRRQALDARGG